MDAVGLGRRVKWVRVVSWLGVLFVTHLGVLWLFQRKLLFPRPPLSSAPSRPSDARQIWLSIPDAEVEAWYLPPTNAARDRAPVLIFFHGNGELIDYWPRDFAEPRSWGMGSLLVEFPGYGRSGGSPSQATITRAALAAYDWAVEQPFVSRSHVVAYGRSLGGGAATILATERPVAALVLESTFTSVKSFAHHFWAPELVVRDPFDSLSLLPAYAGRVLVLHGDRDELIPPEHAEQLARAARRSEIHLLPCGHNDCPRPWSIIREFLVTSQLLAPTLDVEDR
jgi:fermentation-respiration switch protein FrsA (DUF1100 family)